MQVFSAIFKQNRRIIQNRIYFDRKWQKSLYDSAEMIENNSFCSNCAGISLFHSEIEEISLQGNDNGGITQQFVAGLSTHNRHPLFYRVFIKHPFFELKKFDIINLES